LLIDIHTHKANQQDSKSIQNLHADFGETSSLNFYSMGIHPWYIDASNVQDELSKMKIASHQKNILAIGECGLDRICETPFKLQEAIFLAQLLWANEIAKPIIVHCVRAFREALAVFKNSNNIMPVVFHGFNNNISIANELLASGFYLSFGKALFNPSMESVFSKIPSDKIFLETDDSDYAIEDIYKKAAQIKNTSIEQLSLQIMQNSKTVFKTNFN